MALPTPIPGLVVRYSYLWNREYLQGRDEGQKDRPCAIVTVIRADPTGEVRVLVLPVTHSPPNDADLAVEIPARVKERLRLGAEQSWIILSEWNEFIWPGPDLRPVHGGEASVAYGVLPPSFFARVRDRFVTLAELGRAMRVIRT
jgi:hypothetical protein